MVLLTEICILIAPETLVNKESFSANNTIWKFVNLTKKFFWFRGIMNAIEVRLCVVNAAPSESRVMGDLLTKCAWQDYRNEYTRTLNFYLTHSPCLPYWVCSMCLLKAPPATQETGWRQATREIKLLAGLAMRQLTTEDSEDPGSRSLKNYFPQSLQGLNAFFWVYKVAHFGNGHFVFTVKIHRKLYTLIQCSLMAVSPLFVAL